MTDINAAIEASMHLIESSAKAQEYLKNYSERPDLDETTREILQLSSTVIQQLTNLVTRQSSTLIELHDILNPTD